MTCQPSKTKQLLTADSHFTSYIQDPHQLRSWPCRLCSTWQAPLQACAGTHALLQFVYPLLKVATCTCPVNVLKEPEPAPKSRVPNASGTCAPDLPVRQLPPEHIYLRLPQFLH